MNVLVVGASGLLGRNLILKIKNKAKVYAITRKEIRIKESKILKMDLSEIDFEVNNLPSDIEMIYYLAQSSKYKDFPEGSEDMLKINIVAPLKFINWAIKNKVKKFVYASSGGIYTNPTQPIKEFFTINANQKLGFYLGTKLSAELLLRNYASYFKLFAIIRPFFMYGPNQKKTMLIPKLIESVRKGQTIFLQGENGIKINPIYIEDAAGAVANLLDLEGEFIFNIAGEEIVSIRELCNVIGAILNKKPVFKIIDENSADLIADITLMKNFLHKPAISLKKGIELTIGG